MVSHTSVSPCVGEAGQNVPAEEMVKTAIRLALAYHEAQLSQLHALHDGVKPRVFKKMVAIYKEQLAKNPNPEEAFVSFLKYVTQ